MASLSAKEKEVLVAAGENAAQDKLCPMSMAVVVKTVRVMVICRLLAAIMQLLTAWKLSASKLQLSRCKQQAQVRSGRPKPSMHAARSGRLAEDLSHLFGPILVLIPTYFVPVKSLISIDDK